MSEGGAEGREERCELCRFWDGSGEVGACRRYPPVLNHYYLTTVQPNPRNSDAGDEVSDAACSDVAWFWPITGRDLWCGEFRSVPPPRAGAGAAAADGAPPGG
jgi:hypothetical protein